MNTSQIKNFAIQSRNVLKEGVLNRIIALGFDIDGNVTVAEPQKIQGGTVFMGQLFEESFFTAWMQLKAKIAAHGVKEVSEEAAYTWFNRLVAIRIMQKNHFIEPVMQYVNDSARIPLIVAQARAGRLTLNLSAQDRDKLNVLLNDPTKIDEQFALLIGAFCKLNPVIYNCFGGIEEYIGLLLPDNILAQGGFIDLLNTTTYITDEDYKQSELIGWLYQFYISEKKDQVFESFKQGKKAEAEDIPAATQIFTPNWIVKYMVQNTIGRIYLDNNPYSSLGDKMKYLVKTDEPTPEDAKLKIDDVSEYKLIDPACGSGHILVEGFDLLYEMYMESFFSPRQAIENILSKNLIGIDLDTRAKQLATFSLLMKAAMKDPYFLECKTMPRVLDMPEPFAEFYGEPIDDFFPHFGIFGDKQIRECVKAFELLEQANNLGSIMKFDMISDETRYGIQKRLDYWKEQRFIPDPIKYAWKSFDLILALTDKYSAVVANPPYLPITNTNEDLYEYAVNNYPDSKSDLFAVFMDVGMLLIAPSAKLGMINMHSWMFLSSFERLRLKYLNNYHIDSLLHLGTRTFDELSGEVVQNAAFVFTNHIPYLNNTVQEWAGIYHRLVSGGNCEEKKALFIEGRNEFTHVLQSNIISLPGSPIGYWIRDSIIRAFKEKNIDYYSDCAAGISSGDNNKYLKNWHEVNIKDISTNSISEIDFCASAYKYVPCNKGGGFRRWYGNNDIVAYWKKSSEFHRNAANYKHLLFIEGMTWNAIACGAFNSRFYGSGFIFDHASPSLFAKTPDNLLYIIGLSNSCVFAEFMRFINPTINAGADSVRKVPVIISPNKNDINTIVSDNIRIAKNDWDAHETSWDFKENELIRAAKADKTNSLERAFACYRSEWEAKFDQLHENEEDLNRQFIEIYGLQDELKPDVPLDEITILQAGEITHVKDETEYGGGHYVWNYDNVIKQFISYAIGCWMGRYRLDREGLNIAYYPTDDEVCSYDVNGYQFTIDDDAIIPLMDHDNPFEDDNALQKIVNFVKMVFGADTLTENLNFIEHCLGKSIEAYLMKDFWKDHKKMYQNRPIYWLFSSKKGAFQCLAYMHRMNPYTAETVRTKYLLPYIEYLKARIQQDKDRGADLSNIERRNLIKMEAALAECEEYHDRLHAVAIKNIGFDLDDGVVVNYAKFGDVLAKIK